MATIKQIQRHNEVNTGDFLVTVSSLSSVRVYRFPRGEGIGSALDFCGRLAKNFVVENVGGIELMVTEYDSPLRQKVIRKIRIS